MGDWPPGEVQARIRLLMWINDQIAAGVIDPPAGDRVLATDGRILGHGPDADEVERQAMEADPSLRTARVVASKVAPADWVTPGYTMSRVRLFLDQPQQSVVHRYARPAGAIGTIPGLRLIAHVSPLKQLAPGPGVGKYAVVEGIIDTGAQISVVGQELWQRLRPGVVTWLAFDPVTPPAHRKVIIAGGTHDFDLGEMTLHLEDSSGGRLDVSMVAKFADDQGHLPVPNLLGLRGGFLDGRRLLAEPDPWAPFGQAWTLEDP